MFKQIAKRLVGHEQVSWETMAGDLSICLALMFQAALWNSTVYSPLIALIGGMLILFGTMWIFLGIHPLFIENRPTSATIGGWVIIASGCCIMGLGISMIISLDADVSWMPRLAGIFYSLAIFSWVFVLLKVAPITRSLLMGIAFFVLASGYALICNAQVVINTIVSDMPHIEVYWDQGIAYVLSGSAIIAWMLLIVRKIGIVKTKSIIPLFVFMGVVYIGIGIVLTMALVFP